MKHVLFDLKQCLITPPLDDEEYVKETLIEAAKIGKLEVLKVDTHKFEPCLLYTSPSPRDYAASRMPSSA